MVVRSFLSWCGDEKRSFRVLLVVLVLTVDQVVREVVVGTPMHVNDLMLYMVSLCLNHIRIHLVQTARCGACGLYFLFEFLLVSRMEVPVVLNADITVVFSSATAQHCCWAPPTFSFSSRWQ